MLRRCGTQADMLFRLTSSGAMGISSLNFKHVSTMHHIPSYLDTPICNVTVYYVNLMRCNNHVFISKYIGPVLYKNIIMDIFTSAFLKSNSNKKSDPAYSNQYFVVVWGTKYCIGGIKALHYKIPSAHIFSK